MRKGAEKELVSRGSEADSKRAGLFSGKTQIIRAKKKGPEEGEPKPIY